MDDLDYTTNLGGRIAASQILLVAIAKRIGVVDQDLNDLISQYRTYLAARDVQADKTSNMHFRGFLEAMTEMQRALEQKS